MAQTKQKPPKLTQAQQNEAVESTTEGFRILREEGKEALRNYLLQQLEESRKPLLETDSEKN